MPIGRELGKLVGRKKKKKKREDSQEEKKPEDNQKGLTAHEVNKTTSPQLQVDGLDIKCNSFGLTAHPVQTPLSQGNQAEGPSTPLSKADSMMAVDDSQLDINDTRDVLEAVETLSSQWTLLSIKLGVKQATLDLIERNHSKNAEMCLYKALTEWLKLNYDHQRHGRPSWKRLAEAVRTLDYGLFEKIANN